LGLDAKLLANADQIGLMRFKEPYQRREERGFSGSGPKLVCPDSGQVQEALSPARITERCCKR
jgi:hypothetical protein